MVDGIIANPHKLGSRLAPHCGHLKINFSTAWNARPAKFEKSMKLDYRKTSPLNGKRAICRARLMATANSR
jgi:hypothetical protein